MNTARPLSPGEHTAGATFGGAMVDVGPTIPLPNIVVEGKSGLTTFQDRPLDLSYGVNLTGIAFGLGAVHLGSSWLAAEQAGARPALSVSQRLFVTTNVFDTTKSDRGFLFVDELQLTGSHSLGPHLVYYGVAQYLDFGNPTLTLSPFLGTDLARGRFHAQLELRWLAATVIPESVAAGRQTFLGRGALSPTVGFRWDFGASR